MTRGRGAVSGFWTQIIQSRKGCPGSGTVPPCWRCIHGKKRVGRGGQKAKPKQAVVQQIDESFPELCASSLLRRWAVGSEAAAANLLFSDTPSVGGNPTAKGTPCWSKLVWSEFRWGVRTYGCVTGGPEERMES